MMRMPDAGTSAGASIESTRSGVPIFHAAFAGAWASRSFASPCAAPPSTQATIVATSLSDRRGSLANSPWRGSACHGGITRSATAFRIARAHGRAASYVVSDIGAISPGWWHETQLALKMGATSFEKVSPVWVRGAWAPAVPCHSRKAAAPTVPTMRKRDIVIIYDLRFKIYNSYYACPEECRDRADAL